MTRGVRGVLIDIDGTLLDSNDAHAQSWADVFAENRMNISFAQVRPLVGMGGDKLVPELTGLDHESPEGKRLSERKKEIFEKKYLPRLRPTRGARKLMERLADERLTLVIATSAGGDELRALLEQAGVADVVDEATSSGDVESSKPDPDVIGAALKRGRLRADEAVMVGDTVWDVKAASACGLPTIGVLTGGISRAELEDEGAIAVYRDCAQLLEHLDDSPIGRL
jgi:HAD superfamily hydrolase (TIGR01509 family)